MSPKNDTIIKFCASLLGKLEIILTLGYGAYCSQELLDKNQRAKMYERLRYLENPMLFELCGTLFDDKNKSVWTGPHSLVHQERFPRKSSILAAITSFMK